MNFFSDHQWWQILSLNATIFTTSFVLQCPLGLCMAFWLMARRRRLFLWQRKTQKLQNKTGTQLPLPTAEGLHSRPTRATSNSLASHENIQNYFSVQIKRMIIIHSRIQAHAHNRRHQQRHNGFFYSCNGILPIIQLTSFRASLCLVPLCRRRLRRRWRR